MSQHQLPIYKSAPPSPLDGVEGLAPNAACTRCAHSAGNKGTCLPHEGESGGLLVLDSYPTTSEARFKRPLQGSLGAKLRRMAEASGHPAAYATALRCAPSGHGELATALTPGLDACLPYLQHTLDILRPTRILALGSGAIYSLTGTVLAPSTMRKGFAWQKFAWGWVPVFYLVAPVQTAKNKFLAQWLEEDFQWALTCDPVTAPPEPGETWAKLVTTEVSAKRCLSEISTARWTAVDAEWAGRPYDKDFKLLSIAMTPRGDEDAWVWTAEALADPTCRSLLAGWLRDTTNKKVGSYFKADTVAFHAGLGVWTRGVVFDTRLARRLMDAEASGRLADMAHLVGRGGHKDELKEAMTSAVSAYRRARSRGTGGLFKVPIPPLALPSHGDKLAKGDVEAPTYGFAFVEPELLYRYNAADAVITAQVGALLEEWLAQEPEGMRAVAAKVALPASDTYARVESWGMRVDREALQNVGTYLDLQTESVVERLRPYGYDPSSPDSEFDPGSPKKIGKLLFETLGLKSDRLTEKGAQATDAEALEALADKHPVVKDILQWRSLTKMRSSYVDNILSYIRDDGRVHPTIHPDGARTGRTSSSSPNLQVMPSIESSDPMQAEMARMFRACFVPAEGHVLLEVDYSQLELRVAADLSGDPEMLRIFKEGQDYHLRTAQLLSKTLWNIEPQEVTDTHRREVKACIAEGSLVLTSSGLKEIQTVTLDDLVWDGVEWVAHEGVIFQGLQEVITYDGLTATPDHIIFTEDGQEVRFASAAQAGCRLAVTAIAGQELRHAPADRNALCRQVPMAHRHDMRCVSAKACDQCGQYADGQDTELSVYVAPPSNCAGAALAERSACQGSCGAVFCNRAKNYKSQVHCLSTLRSARDSEQVCEHTRVCGVLPIALAARNVQEHADRPDQQRRALRAGELAAGARDAESSQYIAKSVLPVSRAAGHLFRPVASTEDRLSRIQLDEGPDHQTGAGRGFCREHSCEGAAQAMGQKRVYDILNAGPRNRFTVSGKLVHNCNFALLYDDSPHGIAYRIGITPDKAETIRDAVFGCFPMLGKWIAERVKETAKMGCAWTWWDGLPARRRPLIEANNLDTPNGKTQRRSSWNTPIQGTGNEYLVASAIQVVEWIVGNGIPAKLLVTIHDSMLLEVRHDSVSEVHARVLQLMCSHQTKNGVPLAADAKVGRNWATMQKWKAGAPCPLEECT